MTDSSYHSLIESTDFINKLNVLNSNLKKELENISLTLMVLY